MLTAPERLEIDYRTLRLLVGLIALFLASVASTLAGAPPITSISASYHAGGPARDVFVGSLFAISAFLLAYNGRSKKEMVLSKVAAVASLVVAVFPCGCGSHPEMIRYLHGVSAAVMFFVLAFFCLSFRRRAASKGHTQARARSVIYGLCGAAMLLAIGVMAVDTLLSGAISDRVPRLTFYGESAALFAFGVAWLTASHILPVISSKGERFSPFA